MDTKLYSIVVSAALLIAGYLIWQQQKTINNLREGPAKEQVSLEKQKLCAERAEKTFTAAGWRQDGGAVNGYISSFTDHYAPAYNKCFIQLYSFGGTDSISEQDTVTDAFENKEYANYFAFAAKDDPTHQLVMTQCDITIPGKQMLACHSKTEWTELVKQLMQSD